MKLANNVIKLISFIFSIMISETINVITCKKRAMRIPPENIYPLTFQKVKADL